MRLARSRRSGIPGAAPLLPSARWAPAGASAGCAPLQASLRTWPPPARPQPCRRASASWRTGLARDPGSVSSWRRLLRLPRLTNGSLPSPPRVRAPFLCGRPFPSALPDRPNWFLRSREELLVSLPRPRPPCAAGDEAGAGAGGGSDRLSSLCPSPGRRGAQRQAPGLADAA